MTNRIIRRRIILIAVGLAASAWLFLPHIERRACFAQSPRPDAMSRMRQHLQSRVAANPNDASSWRLLGRIHLQDGNLRAAHDALQRAVQLDPISPAAHFDFGNVLIETNQLPLAARHFQRVVELAPQSEYGRDARVQLSRLPPPPADSHVMQAGYEIRRFDGSSTTDRLGGIDAAVSPSPQRVSIRVEGGGLYNSNVTLTPTSRSFFSSDAASFQGFLNPVIELRMFDNHLWRSGPTFAGYFSVNENDFRDLNLQSYQPGWFVERTVPTDHAVLVPRVNYDFTLDQFDGTTFGQRHAITSSLTSFWNRGDTSIMYWTIDHTDFTDDGAIPTATSRDGWTNTLGLSHIVFVGSPVLESITGGAEVQIADTRGTDFTYNGFSLFAEAAIPLTERTTLFLEGSWGYRDYHEFTLTPSRNETVWRGGVRIQRRLSDHWSTAAVFNYDRFDSKNVLFEAERYVTGVIAVFEY